MNTFKNVAILILAGALALFAQAPGSSFTLTTSTSCAAPGLGVFSLCKQSTGGPVTFTDEGSPYAKVNLVGVPGPAGAQGVKGDTGATGAPGPAGTMPSTYSCTSVTISATGVWTFSGCK